jgi:hypothetical protein
MQSVSKQLTAIHATRRRKRRLKVGENHGIVEHAASRLRTLGGKSPPHISLHTPNKGSQHRAPKNGTQSSIAQARRWPSGKFGPLDAQPPPTLPGKLTTCQTPVIFIHIALQHGGKPTLDQIHKSSRNKANAISPTTNIDRTAVVSVQHVLGPQLIKHCRTQDGNKGVCTRRRMRRTTNSTPLFRQHRP